MPTQALIEPTAEGLRCAEGGFYIDPWRPVEKAVITHAHSDHAAPGCGTYLCSRACEHILRARLGASISATAIAYGEAVQQGSVQVSLHPAGHILGSAQVRVERRTSSGGPAGEVWVVSGDYKVEPDDTCDAFEPLRCHTFITESTFALPIYRWKPQREVARELNEWWVENQRVGRTSIVFAYALGKAQRVLSLLDPSIGPIGAHGAVRRINEAYRQAGVSLPSTLPVAGEELKAVQSVGLIVAPPSAARSPWLRRVASKARGGAGTSFASGWMAVRGQRRRLSVDRGFVLSDHADWAALLETIELTGAEHIGVTHGYSDVLVRLLSERGKSAFVVPSAYTGERAEVGQAESEASPDGGADAEPPASDGALDLDGEEPTP